MNNWAVTAAGDIGGGWSEALGGLLSLGAAAERLGAGMSALRRAAGAGEVIVSRDSGGRDLYPGFQFRAGWPPAALIAAYRTIAAVADPWTAASWAAAPDPQLADRTPAECAAGAGADQLLELARRDAARLAA